MNLGDEGVVGAHHLGPGEMPGFPGMRVKDDNLGPALSLSPALPGALGRLVSGLFSLDASDAVYLPALGVESLERPRVFHARDLSGEMRGGCLPW